MKGNFRKELFVELYRARGGQIDGEFEYLLDKFGWSFNPGRNTFYAQHKLMSENDGKRQYLHRMVIEKSLNRRLLKTEIIDHRNGDGLDNRLSNLRICTHGQNLQNRKGLPSDNKSGYMGVTKCRQTGKWSAELRIKNHKIWLGRFSNKQDAIQARRKAEKEHWGEFAPNWGKHGKVNNNATDISSSVSIDGEKLSHKKI